METVELKSSIHKIIDRIQSEQLLQTLYDFLRVHESSKSGQLWNSLTEDQKQEVLLAFEESENEDNLVSRDQVFKK